MLEVRGRILRPVSDARKLGGSCSALGTGPNIATYR
jgi:hypothetical protein